ncbi:MULTISPECIES: YjiG family protein [unclassified Gilliamella]|uniref:YjiG family protein n=1 Tax=unclassified Gilliamella TaxID=2685620 RepID=UPI002269B859|nr:MULTISPECIES: YjiG family protein [unclassified Gilliamella]MCX8600809.1 YjiG family protein [Gilliamella sp. B3722]MCX8609066.1 YjiG family protein [Gilliamella sp. B3771]MCX8610029.1 YjiG family protein [Gilliamella sp. B3891]MCX8612711.1 YjiG family protein [Gilliamella sp. B3773]MCX8616642.1 YjiG family protein [Gilliamella sp. B3770]
MSNSQNQTNNPLDIFVIGARKGFNIAINNLMPNIIMAFVITEILKRLGLMQLIGDYFSPVMGLFGLPGEAITVLLTAWLSASAGTGVAVNLITQGLLSATDVTILAPAIFLMGSQLQYMGRLLGVADVPKKYWPLLMVNSIVNGLIAMIVMRFIV